MDECRHNTLEPTLLTLAQRHCGPCSLLVMVAGLDHRLDKLADQVLREQGPADCGALRRAVLDSVCRLQMGWQGMSFRQVVDVSQAANELHSLTRAVAEQPYAQLAAVCAYHSLLMI